MSAAARRSQPFLIMDAEPDAGGPDGAVKVLATHKFES